MKMFNGGALRVEKLHNEDLHNLCSSARGQMKERAMERPCSIRWKEIECTAYNIWVEKSVRKKPKGKPRHRWKNNLKLDLEGIKWEFVN
jgi:hypothetical protein